ncbi:MAG: hypothetical protein VYD19_01465 [Myxococcota bacterium]|nr:hypothetical protein [Myxococcota bacterium]
MTPPHSARSAAPFLGFMEENRRAAVTHRRESSEPSSRPPPCLRPAAEVAD